MKYNLYVQIHNGTFPLLSLSVHVLTQFIHAVHRLYLRRKMRLLASQKCDVVPFLGLLASLRSSVLVGQLASGLCRLVIH